MTDAQLDALIGSLNDPESPGGNLVTRQELVDIFNGLKGQQSLTDIPGGAVGDVPRWNGTQYVPGAVSAGNINVGEGNGVTIAGGIISLGDQSFNQEAEFRHTASGFFSSRSPVLTPGVDAGFIRKVIKTSEFGTNPAVGAWYESIIEATTNQEGNPTARRNPVWSFGYNYNSGEVIPGEGYMRIGMESNFRPGGGEEWFEFHFPEVRYRNGHTARWYSIIANKSNGTDARHLLDASLWQLRDVNDTNKVYAQFGTNSRVSGGIVDLYGITAGNVFPNDWSVRFNMANDDLFMLLAPRNGGNTEIRSQSGNIFIAANQASRFVEFVNGRVKFRNLVNAANDGAAAALGVDIDQPYRNGSVMMIRVS